MKCRIWFIVPGRNLMQVLGHWTCAFCENHVRTERRGTKCQTIVLEDSSIWVTDAVFTWFCLFSFVHLLDEFVSVAECEIYFYLWIKCCKDRQRAVFLLRKRRAAEGGVGRYDSGSRSGSKFFSGIADFSHLHSCHLAASVRFHVQPALNKGLFIASHGASTLSKMWWKKNFFDWRIFVDVSTEKANKEGQSVL